MEIHLYDKEPWLQFWNKDDKLHSISARTSNDGSFVWNVPGTIAPATNYYVKLCIEKTTFCVDSSTFAVKAIDGRLNVLAPTKDSKLHQHQTTTLRWSTSGAAAGKKVNLYVARVRYLCIVVSQLSSPLYFF